MFMARFFHPVFSSPFRKSECYFLAFAWVMGLVSGSFVFRYSGSDLVSQMPLAANSQPSIFGLLTSCLLPFLFSAFAVYIRATRLLCGICFMKAFLVSYVSWGVLYAFSGCGWLVRGLLLFTDIWGTVLLYHYCHRHISGLRSFSAGVLGLYASALVLVSGVDQGFISPLLRRLLS